MKDIFSKLQKEISVFDAERERLIGLSRKLLLLAKQIIYQVHRNELVQSASLLEKAQEIILPLQDAVKKNPRLKIGAVTAAYQEWGEAKLYDAYARTHKLLGRDVLGLEAEDYLLACTDLSGELVRRCVLSSIAKNYSEVHRVRDFLDELLGEFLYFDFRNGELRKKTDQMRWNLQKIEGLLVHE